MTQKTSEASDVVQAALGQGGVPLRPGDSVLVPHTPDSWTVDNGDAPSVAGAALEWRLAAITLLLPKVLQLSPSGPPPPYVRNSSEVLMWEPLRGCRQKCALT